jgi:hypothetical protein
MGSGAMIYMIGSGIQKLIGAIRRYTDSMVIA